MKPVAILGCGPAGLMAAHAVGMIGRPVAIFSKGDEQGEIKKSRLGGAQFLHRAIPMICEEGEPDAEVKYRLTGTADNYRKKVYGDLRVPFVSMQFLENGDTTDAWSLQAAYDKLWSFLGPEGVGNVVDIGPEWIQEALEKEWFDAILSTVPAPAICRTINDPMYVMDLPPHTFLSQEVTIANEAMHDDKNTIFYNGDPEQSWSRSANLFGYGSTEWGQGMRPSLAETFQVRKPLHTNCDCWADKVVRLGRYGSWTKGVLTHHAFDGAAQVALGL